MSKKTINEFIKVFKEKISKKIDDILYLIKLKYKPIEHLTINKVLKDIRSDESAKSADLKKITDSIKVLSPKDRKIIFSILTFEAWNNLDEVKDLLSKLSEQLKNSPDNKVEKIISESTAPVLVNLLKKQILPRIPALQFLEGIDKKSELDFTKVKDEVLINPCFIKQLFMILNKSKNDEESNIIEHCLYIVLGKYERIIERIDIGEIPNLSIKDRTRIETIISAITRFVKEKEIETEEILAIQKELDKELDQILGDQEILEITPVSTDKNKNKKHNAHNINLS